MQHLIDKRNYTLEVFKLIAAFFVIAIHTQTTGRIDGFNPGSFSFITDIVARFAVPFYFMVSGYFIDFSNRPKLMRRLAAILVLYAVWSVLFITIRAVFHFGYPDFFFTQNETLNSALNIGYKTIFYGWERHLWFFTGYIIAALTIMLLAHNTRLIFILAFALYVIGLSGQEFRHIYPQNFVDGISSFPQWLKQTQLTRNGIFLGIPCMAVGFLLRKHPFWKRIPTVATLLLIPIAFLLQYIEGIKAYKYNQGEISDYYTATIIVAALILISGLQLPGRKSLLSSAGKLSTGVYLLHPLFMYLSFILIPQASSMALWPYIYTPLLFIASMFAAYLFRKALITRKLISV